ncbi:MAG: pilus assembly protein TadG-related protein [Frankia sp.]
MTERAVTERAVTGPAVVAPAGRDDGGTILILTLGYVMLALMLIVVVVDVSALYLARRGLAATADGAALAAAQQIDEPAVYQTTGAVTDLPLGDVEQSVARYSAQADPTGDTTLRAVLTNPTTVHVDGARTVTLPLVGLFGIGSVTVRASADAQAAVRP